MLLHGLETVLKQNASEAPHVAGHTLTVADLAIWRAVGWLSSGLDGIPSGYVRESFPKLWALHQAVDKDEQVLFWKAKHARHYAMR